MSRSITKFIAAFMLVTGFALSALAQDESNIIRPITKSGSAAFVFDISGLGAFGPVAQPIGAVSNGTTSALVSGAGMKYYLSDDLAARILLAFGTTDDGNDESKTTNVTTMQVGIGAIVEAHFGPLYSTSPYVGGGVKFATGSITSKTSVGGTSNESKISGTQLSIMAIAGFDWFFTRGMAIGAEWALGYSTSSSSSESGGTTVDGPTPSGIGIGMVNTGGGIGTGISTVGSVHAVVYF